jgi:hypothetical protein
MSSKPKVTHKLRAILLTDVKGYNLLLTDYAASKLCHISVYWEMITDPIEEIKNRR